MDLFSLARRGKKEQIWARPQATCPDSYTVMEKQWSLGPQGRLCGSYSPAYSESGTESSLTFWS